jgi:hypothetical protein
MLDTKPKSKNFVDSKADAFAAYFQAMITYFPILIGQRQLSKKNSLGGEL